MSEGCSEMLRTEVVDVVTCKKLYSALLVGGEVFCPVRRNLLLGGALCYTSRRLELYDDATPVRSNDR